MLHSLVLIAIVWLVQIDSFEIKKINDESFHFFKINQIMPNPMSNPNSIFTHFTIPDTLDVVISIINDMNDTISTTTFLSLTPGEYQLSWNYEIDEDLMAGIYTLNFNAFESKRIIYAANLRILLF